MNNESQLILDNKMLNNNPILTWSVKNESRVEHRCKSNICSPKSFFRSGKRVLSENLDCFSEFMFVPFINSLDLVSDFPLKLWVSKFFLK